MLGTLGSMELDGLWNADARRLNRVPGKSESALCGSESEPPVRSDEQRVEPECHFPISREA